jgi:hypothetical protein
LSAQTWYSKSGLLLVQRLTDLPIMPTASAITLSVDPSLQEHFAEHLAQKKSGVPPEVAITNLIATILDNSPYPIRAQQTGNREIRIKYQIRSFSQPIFE